ncbi:MAG TPA: hypothetical protein VNF75_03510 [Candidatus Dormibacteraeota bacterium]|nr:hypothetical protein [Candidatus Dormibacteraeota bacterium]
MDSSPPPAPALSAWQVTGQIEGQQFNDQHQLVPGVSIMFTTGQGHQGTVFVPQAQYNAARVRELVAARAALMDEVGGLSGSG